MIKKKINDDIYNHGFTLIISTRDEIISFLEKKYQVDWNNNAAGAFITLINYDTEEEDCYLWVRDDGETELKQYLLCTVLHELIHASMDVTLNVGIVSEKQNSEPLAYYYIYLFNQVFPVINKYFNKNN